MKNRAYGLTPKKRIIKNGLEIEVGNLELSKKIDTITYHSNILRFGIFRNSLKNFLEYSKKNLEKISKI
jgi:hypothetical protein